LHDRQAGRLGRPGWGTEPNLRALQRCRWDNRVPAITVPSGFDLQAEPEELPNAGGGQPLARTTLDSLVTEPRVRLRPGTPENADARAGQQRGRQMGIAASVAAAP
jgi:hypothetical protein